MYNLQKHICEFYYFFKKNNNLNDRIIELHISVLTYRERVLCKSQCLNLKHATRIENLRCGHLCRAGIE